MINAIGPIFDRIIAEVLTVVDATYPEDIKLESIKKLIKEAIYRNRDTLIKIVSIETVRNGLMEEDNDE
jgi:hypothetical protein